MFGPFRSAAQAGAAVAMAGALTGAALAACDHDGTATPRRPTETPASDAAPAAAAKKPRNVYRTPAPTGNEASVPDTGASTRKPRNVYRTAPALPDSLSRSADDDSGEVRAKKPRNVYRAGR